MNYRIVERESFRVAGKVVTSSLENNVIPQFWDECKKDGTLERLLEVGVDTSTYGMCFGYNEEGINDYMVGTETVKDAAVDLKTVTVPKSAWLVFESVGPINPALGNTWTRIYGEFLPQSIYKQSLLPTIEKYFSNDVNAEDYLVEIWIPVLQFG